MIIAASTVLQAIPDYVSNNVTSSILAVCVCLFAFVYYKALRENRKYTWPPGPSGWPLIGSLYDIRPGGTTNEDFLKMCQKYNKDMVTLKLFGTKKIVILNSYKAIKESFISQSARFAGRPQYWPFYYVNKRNSGIFFENYTEAWKREKKYAVKTVRHFGYGTKHSENHILQEADRLADYIANTNEKPFAIDYPLSVTMMNVTFEMVFSKTYKIDDPDFKVVCEIIMSWFLDVFNMYEIEPLLPILDIIPNKRMRSAREKTTIFTQFIQKHIDEHRATLDPDNPRDLTDECLIEMMSRKPDSPLRDFDEEQLLWMILFFIPDQGDTAPGLFRFLMLAAALIPEVQAKVQKEIDSVIGDREPCLADKDNMPYTEACILESLRMDSGFFLITPHINMEDATLMGYHFKKDTEFIPNFWAIHMDPETWGDPENFRPERFIDENGHTVRKDELVPFSVGRRVCLGEQLAQKEFFLFFVRLLQKFNFSLPEEDPKPELKPEWLFVYPPDYRLVANKREKLDKMNSI